VASKKTLDSNRSHIHPTYQTWNPVTSTISSFEEGPSWNKVLRWYNEINRETSCHKNSIWLASKSFWQMWKMYWC